MYVVSDIFELKRIGRFRDFEWSEHLLCGVAVHGADWRGYQAAAEFYLEAAKLCGVMEQMVWASYTPKGQMRSRPIAPKSFERLARGALSGAKEAMDVLLRGERPAPGSHLGNIGFGGEAGANLTRRGINGPEPIGGGPPWKFKADFIFPLNDQPVATASHLLQLSVDLLGAEYGYYFVQDDLCFPSAYDHGISAPLEYKTLEAQHADEIGGWCDYSREQMWVDKRARLRDVFELNLLSRHHLSEPIEGLGYLTDWITAQPGRGRLEDLGQGRVLWILTDAEIVEVRPVIHQAGLTLSCLDRVYRDLPVGPENPFNPKRE